MSLVINVTGAVSLLRAIVNDVLTVAGEAPRQIALTTSAEQLTLVASDLPLTVIEFGKASSEQQGMGEYISAPMMIHHIRATEPVTGSGAITAASRLQSIAKRLKADYRLQSVAVAGSPTMEKVDLDDFSFGSDSPAQRILTRTDQSISMVAATLSITLHWYEFFS